MTDQDSSEPLKVSETPFFGLFDGLLRRRESYFESIFDGREVGGLIRWCLAATLFLGGLYGVAMGTAGFANGATVGFLQVSVSALKVPLLFLLSLLVCYPVLYFVIVLMGSRLTFGQTLALILIAVTMNAVLLAGCAPIVLFFVFTGSGYAFIKILHVAIFAFSGCWAMMALWHGLTAMCEKSDLYPKQAIKIMQVWILIYGFVGTQMAWSLRPFIGSPDKPFEVLRADQGGNFYQAVMQSFVGLFQSEEAIEEEEPPPGLPGDPSSELTPEGQAGIPPELSPEREIERSQLVRDDGWTPAPSPEL